MCIAALAGTAAVAAAAAAGYTCYCRGPAQPDSAAQAALLLPACFLQPQLLLS